jgi:hypothetical protein
MIYIAKLDVEGIETEHNMNIPVIFENNIIGKIVAVEKTNNGFYAIIYCEELKDVHRIEHELEVCRKDRLQDCYHIIKGKLEIW